MKEERAKGKTVKQAAAAGNMCEKTARNYLAHGHSPSELKGIRNYRTREDPFEDVWQEVEEKLELEPELQAKTILEYLQQKYPGKFHEGQVRTLQRRIKNWRAQKGPAKDVVFNQVHTPAYQCQSDFTCMDELAITINRIRFKHMFYHVVLTYSNWESGMVCASETFEALSEGLQKALWELGGCPTEHRTDRLSAAIHNNCNKAELTQRYKQILSHYGMKASKTQPYSPHENGDIEQAHYRLKKAIEQALMIRGSRDFASAEEYEQFLEGIISKRNKERCKAFRQEQPYLKPLPYNKLPVFETLSLRVPRTSLIRVRHNQYSVPSRLIGEWVNVRLYANELEVYHGQKFLQKMPRIGGRGHAKVEYRHIIESLLRKPGAFESYKHRAAMFPSSHYRMAYDLLKANDAKNYVKQYLQILQLAANEGEELVKEILSEMMDAEDAISAEKVKTSIEQGRNPKIESDVEVIFPDLSEYDDLIQGAIT